MNTACLGEAGEATGLLPPTVLPLASSIPYPTSVQKLRESGLIAHWLNRELSNASECLQPPTSDRYDFIQSLPLPAFLGSILMVLTGEYELCLIHIY
ncbi:hypothetical protein Pcinc_000613 [Petrolisthes cinctipes]|uniref:Uncharacterized protein n=1 Tax=Petrolisthes cinctipes TaxID=88211 RepID=A0AAE1L6E9_PETCI|nr:hypothetical protein Pcinc_000613 [Petrolisthes cinctipes]